ncbi:MAG: hypothetical protein LC790_21460 [Actinobacteria bacterium]|nr:hypothetical protein [Actinomycetota bacterium]
MAEGASGGGEGDPDALRAGYERLREAVLSGRPDGFRLGHGVLATRGTVAWIAAAAEFAPSPPAAGEAAEPPPASSPSALPGAGEVVAVLAQMALAHAA